MCGTLGQREFQVLTEMQRVLRSELPAYRTLKLPDVPL